MTDHERTATGRTVSALLRQRFEEIAKDRSAAKEAVESVLVGLREQGYDSRFVRDLVRGFEHYSPACTSPRWPPTSAGMATMADGPLCQPCSADEHGRCTDLGEYQRDCWCNCAGIVNCPTCGHDVILFADDPEDPSYASADCCTWAWADTFDGCIRLDLSGATNGSGSQQ